MQWIVWYVRMIVEKLHNPKVSWQRIEAELSFCDSIEAGQVIDPPEFTFNDPNPNQFSYDA